MNALQQQFVTLEAELNTCLIRRQTTVRYAILALLSGQHFLQLGPPGTGKSLLVRALALRITGATYFEKLMGQYTTPEEIFGPIDMIDYAEHRKYRRIPDGSLSTADIAFLDEVYKGNSAILQSLLTVINERLIHEVGTAPQTVPLLSLFAASNEVPEDETLLAFDDRFLLREVVNYVESDDDFISLITGKMRDHRDVDVSISREQILQAQEEVQNIKGSADALEGLVSLRSELRSSNIPISDRTWRGAIPILKATAWIEGHQHINRACFRSLQAVLWRDPKDAKVVRQKVLAHISQLEMLADEYLEKLQTMILAINTERSKARKQRGNARNTTVYRNEMDNAIQAIDSMYALLTSALDQSSTDCPDAKRAIDELASTRHALAFELLKASTGQ